MSISSHYVTSLTHVLCSSAGAAKITLSCETDQGSQPNEVAGWNSSLDCGSGGEAERGSRRERLSTDRAKKADSDDAYFEAGRRAGIWSERSPKIIFSSSAVNRSSFQMVLSLKLRRQSVY
jgi:hypothetical protein